MELITGISRTRPDRMATSLQILFWWTSIIQIIIFRLARLRSVRVARRTHRKSILMACCAALPSISAHSSLCRRVQLHVGVPTILLRGIFCSSGIPAERSWAVQSLTSSETRLDGPREVSVCLKHPGFDPDLILRVDTFFLYRVFLGYVDYEVAVRQGEIVVEGSRDIARALPRWIMWSSMARFARERC